MDGKGFCLNIHIWYSFEGNFETVDLSQVKLVFHIFLHFLVVTGYQILTQSNEQLKKMRLLIVDSASAVISPILGGNQAQGASLTRYLPPSIMFSFTGFCMLSYWIQKRTEMIQTLWTLAGFRCFRCCICLQSFQKHETYQIDLTNLIPFLWVRACFDGKHGHCAEEARSWKSPCCPGTLPFLSLLQILTVLSSKLMSLSTARSHPSSQFPRWKLTQRTTLIDIMRVSVVLILSPINSVSALECNTFLVRLLDTI